MEKTRQDSFVLRGSIAACREDRKIQYTEGGYLVCEDGFCRGVFHKLPDKYQNLPLQDYGDAMIIPGFSDLHLHAPQYTYRGTGMDLELLDWLSTYTYPEEARYQDLDYAREAYSIFADDLRRSSTTRACIFATIHVEATELLMDLLEKTGVKAYVGKLNMDRNAPDYYREKDAETSARETLRWISECRGRYQNVKPIVTPRFTPSCTDRLMSKLGRIQKETGLPAQSHLSENTDEIAWVKELCPESRFYGDAYDRAGLFGENGPVVMAHCVFSSEEEIELIRKRGVFIAHCPESNENVSTGIAPVRRYLDEGLHIGLGSDTAGGARLELNFAAAEAIRVSKIRHRLIDSSLKPLTVEDAFYMATRGGGAFFGKVGAFEDGYEFDAVVINDSRLKTPRKQTPENRLERIIYLSDDRDIQAKYVAGTEILHD